jgi:WD40-like Beta Propeller Repeat
MKWFWAVLRVIWRRVTLQDRFRGEDALGADDFGRQAGFMRGAALGFALLAAIVGVAGCNDYGNTFQNPTGAAINFLAPADAGAGGPGFTLTVNSPSGGFVTQTVIQWNGGTIPTTYVSASRVTAAITTAMIAKPGTVFVNTLNPFSGSGNNGLSNVLTFVVNPPASPVPAITSLSPSSAAAGAASFTLTVNGSSFLPASDPSGGSQVRWNLGPTQTTLPIVTISASQIQATVDTSLLVNTTAQPVSAIVTVYNPPAPPTTPPNGGIAGPSGGGGGTSPGGLPFSITPAGTGSTVAPRANVAEETPAVSLDGRYVAYTATQGEHAQIFVRDTCEGAPSGCQPRTSLLSAASDGTPGNDDSRAPSMSSDGRYVAFSSAATNITTSAPAGRQVYLRDTCFGANSTPCAPSTQLGSTDAEGALVGTEGILPSVSASGRFIAFVAVTPSHTSGKSAAQTKIAASNADNSGFRQVFVRDTCIGATSCTPKTTRISLQPGDAATTDAKPAGPALSGNSAHVALPDANAAATLFTRSVAVDDRVFLALTGSRP